MGDFIGDLVASAFSMDSIAASTSSRAALVWGVGSTALGDLAADLGVGAFIGDFFGDLAGDLACALTRLSTAVATSSLAALVWGVGPAGVFALAGDLAADLGVGAFTGDLAGDLAGVAAFFALAGLAGDLASMASPLRSPRGDLAGDLAGLGDPKDLTAPSTSPVAASTSSYRNTRRSDSPCGNTTSSPCLSSDPSSETLTPLSITGLVLLMFFSRAWDVKRGRYG